MKNVTNPQIDRLRAEYADVQRVVKLLTEQAVYLERPNGPPTAWARRRIDLQNRMNEIDREITNLLMVVG